jgi:hypothetical protein
VGGRGSGLVVVLSQHFPGGNEENNIKLNQDRPYIGRDSNLTPQECKSRAITLCQPIRY